MTDTIKSISAKVKEETSPYAKMRILKDARVRVEHDPNLTMVKFFINEHIAILEAQVHARFKKEDEL